MGPILQQRRNRQVTNVMHADLQPVQHSYLGFCSAGIVVSPIISDCKQILQLMVFAAYSQATAYLTCTDQYGHCCMPVTSLSTTMMKLLNVVHRVQSKPLCDCLTKCYLPEQVVKATQLTAEKVCFEVCTKNQWSCYLEAAACVLQHRRRGK